jgi:hypothetical protein
MALIAVAIVMAKLALKNIRFRKTNRLTRVAFLRAPALFGILQAIALRRGFKALPALDAILV